jgi:hypothetical protein
MISQLKKWEFVFVPSFNLIAIDIVLRLFIWSFFIILDKNGFYEITIIFGLNFITSIIIFSVANRNRKAIESFLEMRMISESINIVDKKIGYNQVSIQTRLWKLKNNYKLVGIFLLSPFFAALPLLFGELGSLNIVLFVLVFTFQAFSLFFYRDNFISKKIISIKLNREKYNPVKREEVIKFLNRNSVRNVMKYLSEANDIIILDLQTKIKIYRERLENISFEAIFLGALTFATFGQLISSEDKYKKVTTFINTLSIDKILGVFDQKAEELLPLIILGSLLSSVFYVVLLLKRFAILKSIELAQLKIELADSWNAREEYHVFNVDESNINAAMKFTEQIQIELSNANKICSEISSNLNILTFMRLLGLSSFFFVLLVSAKLLHQDIFLIVLIITIYGVIITLLMNKRHVELREIIPKRWSVALSKSKTFQHKVSKKEETN